MLNSMCGDKGCVSYLAARLYMTKLCDDEAFYDRWYAVMDQKRQSRCDRLRNVPDRRRCIMAYALLSHAMADIGVNDLPKISEDTNGKPYFADSDIFFNISHAGERVIVAISDAAVGCDVECRSGNAAKIVKRFFTKEENDLLSSIDDEKAAGHMFTRLWTLKESVVKCCGDGIRRSFGDFSLVDKNGDMVRTVTLPDIDEEYHIKEYESENGYCYSICCVSDKIEDVMRSVSWEKI